MPAHIELIAGLAQLKMDRPLKERLTGASILVLIAVLFIPELLSGPAKRLPAKTPALQLDVPTNAAATLRTYTVDLNHPPSEASAVAASTTDEPASVIARDAHAIPAASSVQVAAPPAASAALETAVARPQIQTLPAASAPEAAPAGNANVPAKQAAPPKSAAAPKHVVAAKQAAVVKDAAYLPAHAAAADTFPPIDAKGGWSIQLGSFGNRANADKLVRNLRSKGIRVYVASQGGKHRVRAGPFPDRATAERIGARLKSQGQSYTVIAP